MKKLNGHNVTQKHTHHLWDQVVRLSNWGGISRLNPSLFVCFIVIQISEKPHTTHTPLDSLTDIMVLTFYFLSFLHLSTLTRTHTMARKMFKEQVSVTFQPAQVYSLPALSEPINIPIEQQPCRLLVCLNKQQVCSLGNHNYLRNASHHDNICLLKSSFCSLSISVDSDHSFTSPCPSTRAIGVILTAACRHVFTATIQYGLVYRTKVKRKPSHL